MKVTKARELLGQAVSELSEQGRFVIGSGGLKKPESGITLQPNTEYYLGASSSPSHIVVTKVGKDAIEYVSGPDYKQTQKMERWIAEDLIIKGCRTWLSRYGNAPYPGFKEKAKSIQSMLKGGRGKTVNVEDFHRIEVTAAPVGGTVDSLWRTAEQYGGVGGRDGNFVIDMQKGDLEDLKKDSSFKVVSVREL